MKAKTKYIEDTFTNAQIERILDLACRRLKDNYGQESPKNQDDKKIWFELFYKNCAGYNGEKLRDLWYILVNCKFCKEYVITEKGLVFLPDWKTLDIVRKIYKIQKFLRSEKIAN